MMGKQKYVTLLCKRKIKGAFSLSLAYFDKEEGLVGTYSEFTGTLLLDDEVRMICVPESAVYLKALLSVNGHRAREILDKWSGSLRLVKNG